MDSVVTTHDCHDLDAVRSGDLEAFGRIHDRHAPLVLSLCRRRGFGGPSGSPADAEDATQEVFIRAYRKLDTVEDCTRLRSWRRRFVVVWYSRTEPRPWWSNLHLGSNPISVILWLPRPRSRNPTHPRPWAG